MKKYLKYAMLIMILPLFFLSSCEKDEEDPPPPAPSSFEVLSEYLINSNLDLDDILVDWITTAENINSKNVDNYYIIDLRSETDFATGRIPGAVNSTLADILTTAQNATKPIIVVCYTGQSAGHGVCALRLSGYADAKVLKWGMSSWHEDFDEWSDNTATEQMANWETPPGDVTSPITYSSIPDFTSASTTGEGILADRVDNMLTNGFKGINNGDVLNDPTQYFINNYWDEGDVTTYGNIKSTFRLKPWTMEAESYNNLDFSEQIVTYCWTGQTSSVITAYYNMIGYNAVSLKFGVNSMIYDNLTGHKWIKDTQCMNYPYESGK